VNSVGDWLSLLEGWYPPGWAEDWDNPGLQVGDRDADVQKAMVALDPTIGVIREAGEREAQLLITHHPLLFGSGMTSVDGGEPRGAAIAEAIRLGIAVVACHTNADVAIPGVSDVLATRLDIEVTGPLEHSAAGARVKLVTFVPAGKTYEVIEILAKRGAGTIGEYDVCSFRVGGVGTFRPSGESKPKRGKKLVVNEEDEDRVEMVVPKERIGEVVEALVEAHPYEQVAYDIYDLSGPTGLGLGRIGDLDAEIPAMTLAKRSEEALGSPCRIAGDPGAPVRRVAVAGGTGAFLWPAARRAGADALVTADVKHHEGLDAAAAGLVLIDAGHFATEWPWVEHVAERLGDTGAAVLVSELKTDPFEVAS
jgi:dinuclear metal center YbgI/SA1388 family protein